MIKCNSKIKLNMPAIKRLNQAAVTALELTGEHVHEEVVQAQVVPRDTGRLQDEAMFVDYSKSGQGTVSIVHATPYARRLYFHPEYNFHKEPWVDEKGKRHEGNPNAKGEWFEDWLPGGSKEKVPLEVFKKFYRRLAGL